MHIGIDRKKIIFDTIRYGSRSMLFIFLLSYPSRSKIRMLSVFPDSPINIARKISRHPVATPMLWFIIALALLEV